MTTTEYLGEKETAKIHKCSTSKLQQDRHKGVGLPYYKVGRLVLYKLDEVLAYIEKHRIETNDSA